MGFTAVFQEVSEGYIAFVEEIPGANTQGATLEEARENLQEAVELVLEANRDLSRESVGAAKVIREPLKLVLCTQRDVGTRASVEIRDHHGAQPRRAGQNRQDRERPEPARTIVRVREQLLLFGTVSHAQ